MGWDWDSNGMVCNLLLDIFSIRGSRWVITVNSIDNGTKIIIISDRIHQN